MNAPPSSFIRVPHGELQAFVSRALQAVGMPADEADFLSDLLATNDLRGVHSHGTHLVGGYCAGFADGSLNPDPTVSLVSEGPTTVQMDGDGSLGYFVAYEGTKRVIEKGLQSGIAVLSTRNHGHIGAAGIYARLPLEHSLLSFVTSGHQFHLPEGLPFRHAGGNPPMCFGTPTGDEDPLVVDFGTSSDLHRDELLLEENAPGIVFRCVGMAAVAHIWGGVLAGIPFDVDRAMRKWRGATQGSMVIVLKHDLFKPGDEFLRDMDEYAQAVRHLKPIAGVSEARHSGGIEADRERQYRGEGVPVSPDHQKIFNTVGSEYGIDVPW